MRRFILSVLLLGAILGAGHLLNHITAHEAVMNVASHKSVLSSAGGTEDSAAISGEETSAAPDSTAVILTQYIND